MGNVHAFSFDFTFHLITACMAIDLLHDYCFIICLSTYDQHDRDLVNVVADGGHGERVGF